MSRDALSSTATAGKADSLPPMDFPSRISRLREKLVEEKVDAMLVTRLQNIRYLTGFTGSAGLLWVSADELLFVTDGRYAEQSEEEIGAVGVDVEIEITSSDQREIISGRSSSAARIALEAHDVTWASQRKFADEWFPSAKLVPSEGWIERLRQVKDAGEVARIRAAAAIADRALESCVGSLEEHPTEKEFALELEFLMRRLGADEPAFATIVASGPNAAKPHARPTDRHIGPGEVVVIDFGATVDGYRSDMTRTFLLDVASSELQRMFEVVSEAQAAGVNAVRAGVAAKDVDAACRRVIDASGWGDAFVHATGHGLGLDIHEDPRISARTEDVLAEGMTVTVEPGVYVAGLGGVRVEDTVLVRSDGCVPLTMAPKTPQPRPSPAVGLV